MQSDALPTALDYCKTCIMLLQDDPWDPSSSSEDVFLDETFDLYVRTAELYQVLDQTSEALELIELVLRRAHTPMSQVRARSLRASILSEKGCHVEALESLLEGLEQLGVKIRRERTWAECDQLWNQLSNYLRKTDLETLFGRPMTEDPSFLAITVLFKHAVSLSLWTAPCLFLNLAVEMTNIYIFRDAFPHTSFICLTNAYIAFARFKDLTLGYKLFDVAKTNSEQVDKFAYGSRNEINLPTIAVKQMCEPLADALESLESSWQHVEVVGYQSPLMYRHIVIAFSRFSLGHDMAMLEAFCNQGDVDPNARRRGSVFVIGIR